MALLQIDVQAVDVTIEIAVGGIETFGGEQVGESVIVHSKQTRAPLFDQPGPVIYRLLLIAFDSRS